MMQATLMNFGGNTRVVNDIENSPVSIPIGAVVQCDIHDVHFNMIRRAVANETLMVVPSNVRMSPKLSALMDLLKGINTEQYDSLLQRFFEVLPPPGLEEKAYRPTRDMIRMALLDASRREVASVLKLQSQVFIREQGDAITREEVPPLGKPKVEAPPAPEPKRQKGPEPSKKKAAGRIMSENTVGKVKARTKARDKAAKKPPPVVKSKLKRERL